MQSIRMESVFERGGVRMMSPLRVWPLSSRAAQYFAALPFVIILVVIVWHGLDLVSDIKLGFANNVEQSPRVFLAIGVVSIINCGLSFLRLSLHRLAWLWLGVGMTVILSWGGMASEFLLFIFYLAGCYAGIGWILRLFGVSWQIHEKVLLSIAGHYLLTEFVYLIEHGARFAPRLVITAGCAGLIHQIWAKRSQGGGVLARSFTPIPWQRMCFSLLVSFGSVFAALLALNPIIEWDSLMGHVPTVMHYNSDRRIWPNPHILQSYASNFHHIMGLPFYSLAGQFGLKLLNTLYIVLFGFFFGSWGVASFLSFRRSERFSLSWL